MYLTCYIKEFFKAIDLIQVMSPQKRTFTTSKALYNSVNGLYFSYIFRHYFCYFRLVFAPNIIPQKIPIRGILKVTFSHCHLSLPLTGLVFAFKGA